MKRAIKKLPYRPHLILVDGIYAPKITNYKFRTIIRGDEKIPEISAASIIAKVARDVYIQKLSKLDGTPFIPARMSNLEGVALWRAP